MLTLKMGHKRRKVEPLVYMALIASCVYDITQR